MPLVKEIPVVGDFLADSYELSIIVSFAVIFAVALVVVSLFTPLLSSLMNNSYVNRIDQGLGLLFGVARAIFCIWPLIHISEPTNQAEISYAVFCWKKKKKKKKHIHILSLLQL